jgi:hypothetical protein
MTRPSFPKVAWRLALSSYYHQALGLCINSSLSHAYIHSSTIGNRFIQLRHCITRTMDHLTVCVLWWKECSHNGKSRWGPLKPSLVYTRYRGAPWCMIPLSSCRYLFCKMVIIIITDNMIIHLLDFSKVYKWMDAVIMEFTMFNLLHNMIKIRNNSSVLRKI